MTIARLRGFIQQWRGPGLFFLGALSAASPALAGEAVGASEPRVTTQAGAIEGRMLPSGVRAFLGVPYAAPPVRDLRWRAPQPVTAWKGIYHADRFGPQCMQQQRGILTNQYSGAEVTSEDCLYLNIWAKQGLNKAPVIIFLHGGGFFIGAGSMALYGGETVATRDVVFVNLNYRVGPLGFFAHPELTSESGHKASGNYGFLDQIAALRWVQENIAQFGGDPSNVTIAGQSAGSMSVLALQASPLAKGLFQRAVGMSGALIGSAGPGAMRPLAQAEQDGVRLQVIWKGSNLADLRAMPADRLVVPRVPGSPPVGPIEDGYVLPYPIDEAFNRSAQSDVPLVLGFTRDESLGGLGPVQTLADYKARAAAVFGGRADAFLKLYPAASDAEAKAQARVADRDGTMAAAMDAWARAQVAKGKAPVYSYMFARPHSYPAGVHIPDLDPATAGAYHTSEVPFWLSTIDSFNRFRPMRDWSQADRAFSSAMTDSLVAFARSGKPDTQQLKWVTFDPARPRLLELGADAHISAWPDERRLAFFRAAPAQRPAGGAARD
ncbi:MULTISPECIES: carboxylesterase/lipase family protein [Sphingobium]|uniref:carboxylesterase/lipase family protein n=1 Tax=Sphingobium TaxID=165695 RepID=UPI0015EC4292|nr:MULTISPECIES: carboxylesterase family protein [Sphingobium]MCW2363008.1 para-nitrobenzyl esterase [Sphingobium sp. B10D3B]MCW2400312.1 para-nitrobenzyl esterase [Sphingobium sp. B10D7B]MCW2407290.1 para-nitrobenzyl esterase [Sphingobium xanthum]